MGRKPIPYGRQDITQDDILAVTEVLRSDYITQGPSIARFERAVADYCGVPHAVAVANGTAALHLACQALGLGPGDYLWTSPNTFVASANCALYCGASVDFVDIDPRTYNMCTDALELKLQQSKVLGRLPKIVIPVHFAGQPCDMGSISALAKEYGFSIIEDASHAIGATYKCGAVGNCEYSDITVFSFHPVKIITTGEGGMLTTRSRQLAEKLELLRSHGITRNSALMDAIPDGPWYYQQIDLGYNYRITDIQAALGESQLRRLSGFLDLRHALASRYNSALQDLPVTLPWQHPQIRSAFHLYVILLETDELRRRVFDGLRDADIYANVHYIPVHLQPYYRRLGFKEGQFPQAEKYYSRALSLPLFSKLTLDEQDHVIVTLRRLLQ